MMKYVPNDTISVRDAIIGPDINAGSMPIFFAPIGSSPPKHLAMMTISSMETHTVSATSVPLCPAK